MAKKGITKIKEPRITLKEIIDATNGPNGCLYMFDDEYTSYLEKGYVEINPDMTDDNGAVATRATQAGIDFYNSNSTESLS